MPEISLLEPTVLRGVVEKLMVPENLFLSKRIPKSSTPFPTVTWDVIKGSRMMARPNVPNSEAHIVPQLGREQATASLVYLREKKVFSPTTLRWLREPGQLASVNAEKAILREVNDLNLRLMNYVEYALWQTLQGQLVFDYPDVQANVDYKFPSTHKVNASTWSSATPAQIIADIRAWKKLVKRDGQVEANEAFATQDTIDMIYNAFAYNYTPAEGNIGALMSDRMKDAYFASGRLVGFQGMTWTPVEHVYHNDSGVDTEFLADNVVIFGNFTANRPIELVEGPSADEDAPRGHIGKFSKTWNEKDPSAKQILIEYNFLPVVTRPEQLVVADVS